MLPVGKLPAGLMQELLEAGAPPPAEVLLGPSVGEDACAIRVPSGVLVVATDPITLTGAGVGSHAVVINANDVATTGVTPQWFLAAVLLPVGTTSKGVRALFAEMREALQRLGASLVGGHTEVTAAVSQVVVVGQFLGLSDDGHFVRTGGVEVGDRILQVGPAPVEGAAVLAVEARDRLDHLLRTTIEAARGAIEDPGLSIVEAALEATRLGAHALHDPTEGGLATGLCELAQASGLALVVEPEAVLWFEPGVAVCEALGADPWGTLASGTLLAAFAPDVSAGALRALESAGFRVADIGHAEPGTGVRTPDGRPIPRFDADEVVRVL